MGPKCSHSCPYEREAKEEFTYTEEKVIGRQTQKLECCSHKPRNADGHQKLEEAGNRLSLRA